MSPNRRSERSLAATAVDPADAAFENGSDAEFDTAFGDEVSATFFRRGRTAEVLIAESQREDDEESAARLQPRRSAGIIVGAVGLLGVMGGLAWAAFGPAPEAAPPVTAAVTSVPAAVPEAMAPAAPPTPVSESNAVSSSDAGLHDAGTHDAGTHDAGTHDAGTHDAGAHDAGAHDAGAHDAGTHDAGRASDSVAPADPGTP